ncbi:MAG: hypothetical protein MUE47_10950 [Acidobacteria bacterium]|jgi:hypothetical protein|nr:hypothetical protein [Acidobacteriota bacterium]
MRCATVGKLVSERRGRAGRPLHPALEAELARHLSGCPSCAADAALEARLAADLAALPGEPVRTIDVRARVLIALVAEPSVDRRVVTAGQLAFGTAAAALSLACVVLAAAWLGPSLVDGIGDQGLATWLGRGLEQTIRTVRALGVAALETVRAVVVTAAATLTAIPAVRRAWSLAFAALGHLALASMLLLSAWWIGRDVMRPARRAAREETLR